MICRLCLMKIESQESIPLYQDGLDVNPPSIYIDIMEKYLYLKISPDDSISLNLCQDCGKTLRDFDRFYLMVEEKQKSLVIESLSVKIEPKEMLFDDADDFVGEEGDKNEVAYMFTENDYDNETEERFKEENLKDEEMCLDDIFEEGEIKVEKVPVYDGEDKYLIPESSDDVDGKKRRKRPKLFSIEEKATIIQKLQNGEKNCTIANEYGIPPSTVSGIWKNKDKFLKIFEENSFRKKKKIRPSSNADIEEALLKWYKIQRIRKAAIHGTLLQAKADQFGKMLKKEKYQCTYSWIRCFKDRYNIVYSKALNVDPHAYCNDWLLHEWPKLKESYNKNEVFIAKETALFYKVTPDQISSFKEENYTDGNFSEDRITLLVACNMTGSIKRKLLLIGEGKKPKCFRNIKHLPVFYEASPKAWMTSEIFGKTLRIWDRELKEQKKEILLIVENCFSHSQIDNLSKIKLVFLPPKVTSIIQPFDEGIIKSLKFGFRKALVLKMIIDKENAFKLSLLDAVYMLIKSWDEVTPETIKDSFKEAGFENSDASNQLKDLYNKNDISFDEWSKILELELGLNSNDLLNFITFDNQMTTSCPNVDEEILRSISKTKDDFTDLAVLKDSDEDKESSYISTISDAFKAIQLLKYYLGTNGELTLLALRQIHFIEKKLEIILFKNLTLKHKKISN